MSESETLGRYRAIAELGRGGMGRVVLASAQDGRLVAVKQVHRQFVDDEGFRARFRREVAASRRVSGAYTAAVIDADTEGPVPWLASVFVPGPSLRQAVDETGGLPEDAVLRLAAGLATALAEIHRVGLIHRDLKPANVLLAADGPRVIDFGIARALDDGTALTHIGTVVGSPAYMSPEQAQAAPITPASDMFALGSVLVVAATGKDAFTGTSDRGILADITHTEPDLSALPARLRRITRLCLAKDPAARPTPELLLDLIGQISPAAQPWPPKIHELIANQHAEVAELIGGQGDSEPTPIAEPKTEVIDEGGTRSRTTELVGVPSPGHGPNNTLLELSQATVVEPDLVNEPRRPPTGFGLMVRETLVMIRDTGLLLAGVLGGLVLAADANVGDVVDLNHNGYLARTSGFWFASDILHRPSYAGGVAGMVLGAVAAFLVLGVGGRRAAMTSSLAFATLSIGGLGLGWLAETGRVRVDVLSVGDVGSGGIAIGLFFGLAPGAYLTLLGATKVVRWIFWVLTVLTGIVTAACGNWGLTGVVVNGDIRVGLASIVAAALGCGLAFQLIRVLRERTIR
ncbi:serine/threonine protein kinase [Actinocrispum wychmicini]|uniref:Serine/threonine protein kinase n=1 Tax=Actinocrispum wychmicini TaxID=1213861 RepID=A0A4R2JZ43_9PSEU|nr:serine/threonine protein kinase [Actinocrispum wychmicini]